MRVIWFCRHYQAGGIFIQPVHYARPEDTAGFPINHGNDTIGALTSVFSGLPGAGCTTIPAGLLITIIHFVFVNNIKMYFLRSGRSFHRRPLSQDDNIAIFEAWLTFGALPLTSTSPSSINLFDMRTGNCRVALRQKDIKPLADLTFVYRKAYFCRLLVWNGQIITPLML